VAIDIGDVHKNSKLLINGVPYNVDEMEFMKPGKGRAVYRLRLRSLIDGVGIDMTYHSGDRVEEAPVTTCEMQYLYKEDDQYIFMNSQTFEQHPLSDKAIGDNKYYLKEGVTVTGMMLGDTLIGITPPTFIELTAVQVAVSTKTDTHTAQMKTAVMETGLTVGVPSFVTEGDIIKIDTRTGTYVERTGKKR